MTIPASFITRYAIPLVIASAYLGDVDIRQEFDISEKIMRLSDQVLAQARGELDENAQVETFDYIIVGGGVAGTVLANRLTADGSNRVLVLEAGGDPNLILEPPNGQRHYMGSGHMDWGYQTVEQSKACLNRGGKCIWPRGKALGGSSSVNGLVYNRCKPKDYDNWANFTGDQSWSWANLRDLYNSIEEYHGFYEETALPNEHGYDGEMYVGKIDYLPGIEALEEALREKGYEIGDHNAGEGFTYGFSRVDYNIKNGLRWGTYQAFLEPIFNRTNLVVHRYALVTKVETEEGQGGLLRATGVTYERHGHVLTAHASKEVIISGGVVESPKLLMLSGMGPRAHLEELQIPVKLNLPSVGQHMQEHPGVDIVGDSGGFLFNTTFGRDYNTSEAVLEYITNGTGPLNGFSYSSGYFPQIIMGYLNSKLNDDKEWPDIHIYVHESYAPATDEERIYFTIELMRTNTEGSIKLASSDPKDKPIIDPNFYADPLDLERMVDVTEELMDAFLTSTTWQRYGIQNLDVYSKCKDFEFQSRDYYKCLIQDSSMPHFHPTSTCRMGRDLSGGVVDSKLKVFGTENLRVIDASAMPFLPIGNTNLPTMLLASKGAEIILSGQ